MVVGRELWGSVVQPLVQSGPMLHHVSQKSVLITTVFLILCCSPSFLLLSHIFPAGPLTKMLLERCSVVGNAGNLSTLPMLPATWAGRSGNGCRREETAITQVGQGGVNGLLVPGSKLLTAWPPAMEFGLLSPIVKSERWITHSVLCSNLFSSHSGELGLVNDTCKSPIWDQSCCLCRWYCKESGCGTLGGWACKTILKLLYCHLCILSASNYHSSFLLGAWGRWSLSPCAHHYLRSSSNFFFWYNYKFLQIQEEIKDKILLISKHFIIDFFCHKNKKTQWG